MPKCPRSAKCANFTLDPYDGECMFESCLEVGEIPYKRYRRFVMKPAPQKTLAAELAEAEIERLRKELLQEDDHFRHIRARLTTRREYWEKRCLKAEHDLAHLEILSADAKIGRLVRGMPRYSRLTKGSVYYWAEEQSKDNVWHRVKQPLPSSNPAEALRSIQEVGDD